MQDLSPNARPKVTSGLATALPNRHTVKPVGHRCEGAAKVARQLALVPVERSQSQ